MGSNSRPSAGRPAVSEVLCAHDDHVELQDAGKVNGRFRGTSVIPKIVERLKVSGITLPDGAVR
jgi:hypothetical protein